MIVHSAVVICCYCVMMLMFLQGYHGLLSQAMTTERMYGKILTVWSLIHCAYIMCCYCTSLLVYRYLIFSLYHVYFYYLWPPCVADADIIFLPYGFFFFFLSFFLAYSQPSQIGCLPCFHTWCGLSANLGCRSETCCTQLAANTGRKKSPSGAPSHNFVRPYLCN